MVIRQGTGNAGARRDRFMRLPALCPDCGFTMALPVWQSRLTAQCVCCGGRVTLGSVWRRCLAVAPVILSLLGVVLGLRGSVGLHGGAALTLLVAGGAVAFAAMAGLGFLLMRKAMPRARGPKVVLAGAVLGFVVTVGAGACAAGASGGSVPSGVGIGLLVASVSMAVGMAAYWAILAAARNTKGRLAVLGAIWATSISGVLLPYLVLNLAGGQGAGGDLPWWVAELLAVPLAVGCLLGYRSYKRLLNVSGTSSGSASRELDELLGFLCRRAGLRVRRFMRGQIERLAKARGEDLPTLRRRVMADSSALKEAVAQLSWGATSFFREPETLALVLDLMRRRSGPMRVKIVGVSTGEEAYSTAILADIAGLKQIEIHASDISTEGIDLAREGLYHEQAFMLCAGCEYSRGKVLQEVLKYPRFGPVRARADVIRKYFEPVGHGFHRAREALRQRISYSVANVMEDVEYRGVDLVFFRNVISHLLPEAASKALRDIHAHSGPGTLLVLSFQDMAKLAPQAMETLKSLFEPTDETGNVPIFRKRDAGDPSVRGATCAPSRSLGLNGHGSRPAGLGVDGDAPARQLADDLGVGQQVVGHAGRGDRAPVRA